jgi:hypothetical protein
MGFSAASATPSATPPAALLQRYSGPTGALFWLPPCLDASLLRALLPPPGWSSVLPATASDPVYEAGWRHRLPDGRLRTMKRRLGLAWLERDETGALRGRRGRPKPGFLDEHAAVVAKDQLVREVERELAEQVAAAERAAHAPPTFRAVAYAYLDWLERVRGAKPATLRDHRYLLAEPGAAHRRGPRAHRGVIMAALGDRPASEITTREVNRLLADVAATDASPRTVNKHRQLVCAIFSFGCSEATFALPHNPARAADRRAEPERARLDYYSPEEVEALARALAEGRHRDANGAAVSAAEAAAPPTRPARTPSSCAWPPTPDCVAASSSRSAGATSTSSAASSWSARGQRRRRGELDQIATCARGAARRPGGRSARPTLTTRRLHEPRRLRLQQPARPPPGWVRASPARRASP